MAPVASVQTKQPMLIIFFLPQLCSRRAEIVLQISLVSCMREGISRTSSPEVAWLRIGPQQILTEFTPLNCCRKDKCIPTIIGSHNLAGFSLLVEDLPVSSVISDFYSKEAERDYRQYATSMIFCRSTYSTNYGLQIIWRTFLASCLFLSISQYLGVSKLKTKRRVMVCITTKATGTPKMYFQKLQQVASWMVFLRIQARRQGESVPTLSMSYGMAPSEPAIYTGASSLTIILARVLKMPVQTP